MTENKAIILDRRCTSETFNDIETKALERWRGIICYLLNIEETKNTRMYEEEKRRDEEEESVHKERRDTYYELLTHADYMVKHPNRAQRESANILTDKGFSFIL